MDSINIFWWHYPMIGIGALLLANSVVSVSNLPATIGSKLLWISQLTLSVSFLFYPVIEIF